MTGSIDSEVYSEVSRTIREHRDWTNVTLDEPMASRKTLTRRLRAVERALVGVDGLEEFEPAVECASITDDLDAVEERLVALERAVRAVGEHLAERDRVRRTEDGIASVRRAIEALPESGSRTNTSAGDTAVREAGTEMASESEESPSEWLDRVAAGGVTPPPVE